MSEERIELVGGPNDGKFVPDYGPIFREAVPRALKAMYYCVPAEIAHLDVPTINDVPRVREYRMLVDARDGRPRYVFQGVS